MAKVSANYESVVVISTTLGEDGIKAMVEKITSLISQNGT